jgi:predicted dehydrogenase
VHGEQSIRVAVAGCGGIARQYHLRELNRSPAARVVAVADPDPRARALAANTVGARQYADAHDAIAQPDVDAVVVCAPNAVHAELAVAALDAGRHLYLEKPLATDVSDGRRVVSAAERAGTVAAVGFAYRFDPLYARARALLREGVLGELREVSTSYEETFAPGGSPPWRQERAAGGGALLDLGVHHLDLLSWLTGEGLGPVDWAELSSIAGEHDRARVNGRLTGGAEFDARFGYAAGRRCGWVVAGDEGWLAIDRCARRLTLARGGARPRQRRRVDALRRRLYALPVVRRERIFGRALGAWLDGASQGTPDGLPSLADGLRALEAVSAIEAAVERPVRV